MYLVPASYAALLVASLFLPTAPDRLRGALGLPAFALGAASLPYLPEFRGPSLTVWISAALLLLGPAMLLLAAWQARTRLHPRAALLVPVSLAVGVAVTAAWPTLTQGGVLPALVTAGALGMGAWFVWLLGSASGVGRAVRWLDARMPTLRSRHSWGVLLLVTGAMAFRVGGLIWPLWVLSWQPVAVGLGVLCAWWAVPTGRASLALAGAAFAAASSSVAGFGGGWLLLAVAAVAGRTPPRVVAIIAATGAYLAAPELLGAEVLYTVLLVWPATMLLAVQAANEEAATSR
jgi:hypothetical protein